ncbi:MAG TPA: anthranilate synthase component I, partial [Nakamurella sp.]
MTAMSVPSVAPQRDTLRALGEITPSRADFRELARDRRVIPVTRRLLADAITPVGLYATLAGDRPGTFLLESAE